MKLATRWAFSCFLAAILFMLAALAQRPAEAAIMVEAHRGNSSQAPENTLAAIQAAAGMAHRVEFDVQVTRDNKLIVIHDAALNQTTSGTGNVADRNYVGYIDGLSAGSWTHPNYGNWAQKGFTGEKVPTMAQAIEQTLSLGMTPLIERKTGSASAYYNELHALGVLDDVAVISFDRFFLKDLRNLGFTGQLGWVGNIAINQFVLNDALDSQVDYMAWRQDHLNVSAIASIRAKGLGVHVWTVNTQADMEKFIGLGVDGIATDFPHVLATLVPVPEPTLLGSMSLFACALVWFRARRSARA